MTTVIDPLGTPSVIFNGDGTSIVRLTGGASTTTIPAPGSEETIILASSTVQSTFQLSSGFKIGDRVEFYFQSAQAFTVNDENGNVIRSVSSGPFALKLRKIATGTGAGNWVFTISPSQ